MSARRLLLWCALSLAAASAHAQLQVKMTIPRHLYMAYEPIITTVSVTNLTGHDVMLDEVDAQKWFSFQIVTGDGSLVPPRDPNYQLSPLLVPAGQTVKRSVNLVTLYPVNDFGLYRIKASIYLPELHRYFSSPMTGVEISEGKTMWQQTVGVPEGQPGAGSYRLFTLLSFRQTKDNMLYVRVEDKDGSSVYATYPLAHLLTSTEPQIQLDAQNRLHVLQLVGPKTYTYSRIGVNGEWLGQTTYSELKTRPNLRHLANGDVAVAGGKIEVPVATAANNPSIPKLSDRPPGMPAQ